jgi:predicted P-loop ATPase/GTPase
LLLRRAVEGKSFVVRSSFVNASFTLSHLQESSNRALLTDSEECWRKAISLFAIKTVRIMDLLRFLLIGVFSLDGGKTVFFCSLSTCGGFRDCSNGESRQWRVKQFYG